MYKYINIYTKMHKQYHISQNHEILLSFRGNKKIRLIKKLTFLI